MADNTGKASLRVLRFLEKSGNCTIVPLSGIEPGKCIISNESGHKVLMAQSIVDTLERATLIRTTDEHCCITPIGKSKLKRLSGVDENFAAQHRREVSVTVNLDGGNHTAVKNANESPLTRLRIRKAANGQTWLDDEHVEAGERLRRDFTMGQLMQKVTANWEGGIGSTAAGRGGKVDLTDNAIDARSRLEKALDSVGPDLAGVLTDVCCFLKGLELVERERHWPPRSAKLMLRTGLDLLARHYGTKAGRTV